LIYLPPEAKDVPAFMAPLVVWAADAERSGLPAPIIAAMVHYQFVTIHLSPFITLIIPMVGYPAQALKQGLRGAKVLLYAPTLGPHLLEMADREFCIYCEQTKGRKAEAKTGGGSLENAGVCS
jgi:hypothetical protein